MKNMMLQVKKYANIACFLGVLVQTISTHMKRTTQWMLAAIPAEGIDQITNDK